VDSKLHYRFLRYRADWTDCPPDQEFYTKNYFAHVPDMIRAFHDANPEKPGPKNEEAAAAAWKARKD